MASYPNLYPISHDQDGNLTLDSSTFMNAVNYLLDNKDPRAASDLIYLGQSNNVNLYGHEAYSSDMVRNPLEWPKMSTKFIENFCICKST